MWPLPIREIVQQQDAIGPVLFAGQVADRDTASQTRIAAGEATPADISRTLRVSFALSSPGLPVAVVQLSAR